MDGSLVEEVRTAAPLSAADSQELCAGHRMRGQRHGVWHKSSCIGVRRPECLQWSSFHDLRVLCIKLTRLSLFVFLFTIKL